jgi:hypothetical protein
MTAIGFFFFLLGWAGLRSDLGDGADALAAISAIVGFMLLLAGVSIWLFGVMP